MPNRRSVVVSILLSPFLASGLASRTGAAAVAPAAAEWVEAFTRDGLELLRQRDATPAEQASRFRQLIRQYFAIDAVARWVLGRHWNRATPAEREEYVRLFEDFIVYGYVERFSEYSGENIRITRSLDNPDNSAMVYSVVERPSGQAINVTWRVARDRDGTLRMTDIIIDNVSLSQTYRSDFTSTLQQQGGQISGLLAVLRDQVAAQKAKLGIG